MRNKTIHSEKVFVFTNTDIREMVAIIKLSHLFIGNDGGFLYIAVAIGIPSVIICSSAIWYHDWHIKGR